MTRKDRMTEDELERALASLAAIEDRAAPRPGAALVARVLADAAAAGGTAPLPAAAVMRGGRRAEGARGRIGRGGLAARAARLFSGPLSGPAGAAAALAVGLFLGVVAGYSDEGASVVLAAASPAAQEELDTSLDSFVVSDASAVMFGVDTPY